jgi:hypothetical protein
LLKILIKIKLVFDRIKSCSVWKFILNPSSPTLSFAQPAHVLTRSPHALSHSPTSTHRDTDPHPPLPAGRRCRRPHAIGCQVPPRPRRPPPRGVTAPPPPSSAWRRLHRTPPLFPSSLGQKPLTPSTSSFRSAATLGTEARRHLSPPLCKARAPV